MKLYEKYPFEHIDNLYEENYLNENLDSMIAEYIRENIENLK